MITGEAVLEGRQVLLRPATMRFLILLWLAAGAWSAGAAGEAATVLERADSLWVAGDVQAAQAAVAAALPAAIEGGDSAQVLGLVLRRGRMHAALGRGRDGEPDLREALALAIALNDSLLELASLRWLSVAVGGQARRDEALALYETMYARATAYGDSTHVAWGLVGLGWDSYVRQRSEASTKPYREAIAIFRALGNSHGELFTQNSLLMSLQSLGRYDEAVAGYARIAQIARQANNRGAEAVALNNLGTLEYELGSPGQAMARFEEAHRLQTEDRNDHERLLTGANIAYCERELGRYRDARARLAGLLAEARALGLDDLESGMLQKLAAVSLQEGDLPAAARSLREALAIAARREGEDDLTYRLGLSWVLARQDSLEASLAVLAGWREELGELQSPLTRCHLRIEVGDRLIRLGRAAEAAEVLAAGQAEAGEFGLNAVSLQILPLAVKAAMALGDEDAARRLLGDAIAAWERERSLPLDPEWRELRGASTREIPELLLALAAGRPGGLPSAYDELQRFKARTLHERMLGPGGIHAGDRGGGTVTLAELRGGILRGGELLLDYQLGRERSYLFAIGPGSCRVVELPASGELRARLHLYYELLSAPASPWDEAGGGTGSPLESATLAMAATLLGPVAGELAACERVFVVPDGVLNLAPFGLLVRALPGAPARRDEAPPLQRLPSATFLAGLRAPAAAGPAPSGLLAVAARAGERGEALPGAEREIDRLARRYRGVHRAAHARPDSLLGELRGRAILHFAAHSTVSDQSPWRSSIELGGGEGSALRAAEIAAASLEARLAVLASCESATGRILSGEGVQGLTSAFLAAGVPTVLATLWPVDDAATATLMDVFYAALADGEPVAVALERGKARLRGAAATAHPFYWGGFIVVGDGSRRLPLERRIDARRVGGGALLLAALGLGVAGLRGRARKSVIPPSAGRPR